MLQSGQMRILRINAHVDQKFEMDLCKGGKTDFLVGGIHQVEFICMYRPTSHTLWIWFQVTTVK